MSRRSVMARASAIASRESVSVAPAGITAHVSTPSV